jgi:hypothetical protein
MIRDFDRNTSEYEKYSDQWLGELYLQYGSVESVLTEFPDNLPVSPATYHRIIKKLGLVKGAGRGSTSLAQTLYVFRERMKNPRASFEKILKTIPLSVKNSSDFPTLRTIWRIYGSVLNGNINRLGVGIIATPEWSSEHVLVAQEMSSLASSGKRAGEITIPVGFVNKRLNFEQSALRILQREYSTKLAISGKLALCENGRLSAWAQKLIPKNTQPFMDFKVLDVSIKVAKVCIPEELCDLREASSYSVTEHRFERVSDLLGSNRRNLRAGVGEVLENYQQMLEGVTSREFTLTSVINTLIQKSPTLVRSAEPSRRLA